MAVALEETQEAFKLLEKGLNKLLQDKGFYIKSERAQKALTCAKRTLDWIKAQHNNQLAVIFAKNLVSLLQGCVVLPTSTTTSDEFHKHREKMWESYYRLRSSESFLSMWVTFLRSNIGVESDPIFFQFITKAVMDELIQCACKIPVAAAPDTMPEQTPQSLDYKEHNALRYTAGYVIHSLIKKIKKSSHADKDELVMCLEELKCDIDPDEEEQLFHSEDWTYISDRGGLIHISDTTYLLFVTMELEIRKWSSQMQLGSNYKDTVTEKLMKKSDLLQCWSCISINWGEESKELLKMMVDHFITVRGFSAAGAFLEKFKQKHAKTIQKKKALRKSVN